MSDPDPDDFLVQSFMKIRSVVLCKSCQQTDRQADRQTNKQSRVKHILLCGSKNRSANWRTGWQLFGVYVDTAGEYLVQYIRINCVLEVVTCGRKSGGGKVSSRQRRQDGRISCRSSYSVWHAASPAWPTGTCCIASADVAYVCRRFTQRSHMHTCCMYHIIPYWCHTVPPAHIMHMDACRYFSSQCN